MIMGMKNACKLTVMILCVLPSNTGFAAGPHDKLIQEIVRLEAAYGGHLGFMARNLNTGETVGYNATERFPTASAIKLPVMAAFYQLVHDGKIDPDEVVTLTRADMKPGSGVLHLLSEGDRITLLDAIKLMITQSDNTATNLILDRLASAHEERLKEVNDFMIRLGLADTRLLNRLYSPETKQPTPEALRYGIGVSTPADMVFLLTALYAKTLVDPACSEAMTGILKSQFYRDTIPRLLPESDCQYLEIANKTGSLNETKVDVALILSDKANIALAVFVDKQPDHRGDIENRGILLGAMVARAVWNHFTGSTGYRERKVPLNDVDWNSFPGGRWGIYRSAAAPFPHGKRSGGSRAADGTRYPYHPHYDDNSIVVVVPDTFQETDEGTNVIVHFHGTMGDNMNSLEQDRMPRAMAEANINALLVLPQGPYRARDSFWGRLTDEGGLSRLVEDMLATMQKEKVIQRARLNHLILSADGSGVPAAALALRRGRLESHVGEGFLYDTLEGDPGVFRDWLEKGRGRLYAVYSAGNEAGAARLKGMVRGEAANRVALTGVPAGRDPIVGPFFASWLKELGPEWKKGR
jgi:beta-lactamase class A